MQERWVPCLGREDSLEEEMTGFSLEAEMSMKFCSWTEIQVFRFQLKGLLLDPVSSIAWKFTWTEQPIEAMGSRNNWAQLSDKT